MTLNGRTNFFFNNFQNKSEQGLIQDLVDEIITITGIETYYIPRQINKYDSLLGQDDQSSYVNAIPLAVYIETVDGFTGDGNFMSKFGLEIRDQVIFAISKNFFKKVTKITGQTRPNEGDIIFLPLNKKCFQIKFTDKFEMFFQLGEIQSYKVICEVFEYSDEIFNTGIADIDVIQKKFSTNVLDYAISNENSLVLTDQDGNIITNENDVLKNHVTQSDDQDLANETDPVIEFSPNNPFSVGKNN